MSNKTDKSLHNTLAELKASANNLYVTLNSIGDAVISTDIHGCVDYMNPVAEKLTGWSLAEAKSKQLTEVFQITNDQTGKPAINPVQQVLKTGKVVILANHTRLISRDGSEYHIADSASPIIDIDDEISGVVLVFRDVTSEYEVRDAQIESENRYRNLFDNSVTSIWDEDFSQVYKNLDELRTQGVTDLRQNFKDNPQLAWNLAAMVRVNRVNQATLNLFSANSNESFIHQIDKVFGDGAIDVFIDGLCAYWDKNPSFRSEANFYTLNGECIDAIISYQIPATKEASKNVAVNIIDITERKQMEHALQESELKYRTLYDNAPMCYQSLDERGNFLDINPAWLDTLGYKRDEIVGNNFSDLLHPDWRPHFLENFTNFKHEGCIQNVQFKIRHQKGHYLDIKFNGCIGYKPNGEFGQTYCVFQDITSAKVAEDALRKSEAHLCTLVETIPDYIWMKDPEGLYLSCNKKVEQFFGAKQSEILGKTDYDFVNKELADLFREKDIAVMNAETPVVEEEEIPHGDDHHPEIIETIKTPMFDADGKLIGVLGVGRNITERKQAELAIQEQKQCYEELLEFTEEAIFGVDTNGICTFANAACVNLLGYQHSDQLIGQNIHQLIHYETQEEASLHIEHCPMMQTLHTGESYHSDNELMRRADNTCFIAEYWSHPILRDNNLVGVVVDFLDITERRKTEQALRRSQKMEAIGQLSGGIAHDFNNIINIIMGNVDLLRRQVPENEKTEKRLGNIQKSAQRAADLTRQLLSFSRNQEEKIAATDINAVIREMRNLIARSVTPQVEVKYRSDSDLWSVDISPGDFEDSLLNLSLNARDAMSGKGYLTIRVSNTTLDEIFCTQNPGAKQGDYVELSISDTGQGINQEHIEHIFEPFFTTKEVGKGTGLGLAMVYGFMHRCKGFISVDSEPGKGATFHLYMPRSMQTIQNPVVDENHLDKLSGGNETILVVDDEVAMQELLEETLQQLGYRVYTADNGLSGLKLLSEHAEIELVISDVIMPGGLNGYELAEQATFKYPQLKVILMSGYSESVSATASQQRFRTNLLNKPYSMSDLVLHVRKVLENK